MNEQNNLILFNKLETIREERKLKKEKNQQDYLMRMEQMKTELELSKEISMMEINVKRKKERRENLKKRQEKEIENKKKLDELEEKMPKLPNPIFYIYDWFNLLVSYSLIVNHSHSLLFDWMKVTPLMNGLVLMYRATRDGYASSTFHSLCDHIGATLVIIRSSNGYIFGGYNPMSWNSNSQYLYNASTFIFSLTNPTGNPQKMFNTGPHHGSTRSTYNHPSYGPTFGGHDFYISNNCNANNSSFTNLNHSFTSPYSYSTTNAKNFLCGSYYFTVSEIEVYKLN